MKKTLRKIGYILSNFLGIDRLSKSFLNFSKAHLCFIVASNIQSIFVNILLIRAANDVNINIIYNIIAFGFSGLFMVVAAKVVKLVDLRVNTAIGIGFHIAGYLCFLFFMNNIVDYAYFIGMLFGMGGGFFWITYFNSISAYSDDDSRDVSIAFLGIIASVIALVVPAISGVIIAAFVGFTGYSVMFGFAFLFSGISIFLFFRLPKSPPKKGKTHFLECIKSFILEKCWRYTALHVFTRSIREGVFAFFLNVLIYEYIPNEAVIGFNALLLGFVAIFGQYFCGRKLQPVNRIKTMFVAASVLLTIALILIAEMSGATIIILSIVNAFFIILVMNPASSIDFLVIQTMPNGIEYRSEYFALLEVIRNSGRIVGLTFLFLIPKTSTSYMIAIIILTLTLYVAVIFAKLTVKNVKKYKELEESND